jgi:putative transposase
LLTSSTTILLDRDRWAPSKKGMGFVQPVKGQDHWLIDISYLNSHGDLDFLCSVLNAYSQTPEHWDVCETIKEPLVDTIVREALEKYPGQKFRITADKSARFIAKGFDQFIRLGGVAHGPTITLLSGASRRPA